MPLVFQDKQIFQKIAECHTISFPPQVAWTYLSQYSWYCVRMCPANTFYMATFEHGYVRSLLLSYDPF